MDDNKLTRVTIRVSQKVKSYFEERSAETGVAQSALMLLAMEEYIDQKKAIETTPNLLGGVSDMKELMSALAKQEFNIDMAWGKDGKPFDPNK